MADTKVTPAYSRVSDVDVVMTTIRPQAPKGLGNLLVLNFATGSQPAAPSTGSESTQPTNTGSTTGSNADADTPSAQSEDSAPQAKPDQLTDDERLAGLLMRKTDTKTGACYTEYRDLDAVASEYDTDSAVYKKAQTYFAQDNASDRIAVLTLKKGNEYNSLEAFWYFNWTFAILAEQQDQDEIVTLSNIFEANKDHFLVIQSDDVSSFDHLQGQNYVIGLKHDPKEAMDAGLVGRVAQLPVGSATWKFKTIKGITPDALTSNELNSINRVHAIGYTTVAGKDQTTEGKVLSGEYIDTLHGIIWVKSKFESELEKLLQENDKIPYEQAGINMILATGTQVLNKAYEQGIILTGENGKADFSINATSRDAQSAKDLSDRHYGGLSFEYHASGAIHSITVHGQVDSDTILQTV